MGATNLVKAAKGTKNDPGPIPDLKKSKVENEDQFSSDGKILSREEVVEKLVLNRVPDDWGHQYAHFHHAWFGKYKLRAYDVDGNSLPVQGEANTAEEAYAMLKQFKESPAGKKADRLEARPAYNEDPDFMSMSKAERNALKSALRSET